MPHYDYHCHTCATKESRIVPFDQRMAQSCGVCGVLMEYVFPVGAITRFQPFVPYHDEYLNCDIHGRRQKKQILSHHGLQEAGDPEHGGRNFDRSAENWGILPPSGRTFDDEVREEDTRRRHKEEQVLGIEHADGRVDWVRARELKTVQKSTEKKNIREIIDKVSL